MTSPELRGWPASDRRFSRSEVSAVVGSGDAVWERVTRDVLRWRVKTESGFAVDSIGPLSRGDRVVVTARLFNVTVVQPVEVVSVADPRGRQCDAPPTRRSGRSCARVALSTSLPSDWRYRIATESSACG